MFSLNEPNNLLLALDCLINWYNVNMLKSYVNKCKTMSFYKCNNLITYCYIIKNTVLESDNSFNDLDVIFSYDGALLGFL